jgi:2-polyprenyl-6-methoxyphenol hydroxylase-like FAD-dependent oxidoreductase
MSSQVSTQRSAAGASHVLGERAVVIGASMSGLLTARVLADFFRQVMVVDRDHLTADGRTRPGVPQGGHTHLLLPRGAKVLEELFPGLFAELTEAGVPVARNLDQLHFDLRGHVLSQRKLGVATPTTG